MSGPSWRYVSRVRDEIQKAAFTDYDLGRIDEAMGRVARGEQLKGDVKHLRGRVLELRVSVNGRAARILFAHVDEHTVLLALLVFVKKTQRTPPRHIDTAEVRLAEYEQCG